MKSIYLVKQVTLNERAKLILGKRILENQERF